jgi:DNA repair exonuclease SbcCD ATPase subunit
MQKEQTRQLIREMLAIWVADISTNLKEVDTRCTKVEPLWAKMGEHRKASQNKLAADLAKLKADQAKAKMKAINELMERREVERKANHKKMMAKL